MTSAEWILTKNGILQKIGDLMLQWQAAYASLLAREAPGLLSTIQPYAFKVSRGENYQGLPWMVLDYPRLFVQQDILAIRTFFWWGQYVTLTLHLAGKWKKASEESLVESYGLLAREGFLISLVDDPWIHEQHNGFTSPISSLDREAYLREIRVRDFVKISRIYPIEQVENLALPLTRDYEYLVKGAGY